MTVASLQHDLSTDAVRTVVLAAVSCILYVRCVLPEDHFVPMAYDNVAFKVLRPKCSEASTLLYGMLDHGVYDAIQRQYLRTLTIAIIKSPDHRDQSLESYHLHFSYPHPGTFTADAELVHSDNANNTALLHHKLGHFDSYSSSASILSQKKMLAQQVHQFMRSLALVLHTLHTLPINCFMDMHLEYNESAPKDYEPMFFRASEIVPRVPSPVKLSTALPVVETQWHSVKLDIETMATRASREATQPLSSPARKDVVHLLNNTNTHHTQTSTRPTGAQPHYPTNDSFPQAPNSDDTILDDLDYEDNQHLRAARRTSQQPCETTAAAAQTRDYDDSPTQSQWPTQPAAAHTDSGTQLDSETYLHPPAHAPDPTTVITLSSSDDPVAPPAASPPASPPASPLPLTSNTVDCLCQLNDSDGGMLQCESCHAWMHVVCYGYLYVKDPRLPERFLCAKCNVGSDKFKGVSKEDRRELGMFRSAVSVIWNEVPVAAGKKQGGAAASQSSGKTKGDKRGEHVWRDKQLAARLFITVEQANHLLARAVDEHIASWHARGKIAKRSQVLVVVHKQSNDARRALHVLFNPNLTRLPPSGMGALVALEPELAPAAARAGASRPVTGKTTDGAAGKERDRSAAAAAGKVRGSKKQQAPKAMGLQTYMLSPARSQTQVCSQTQLDSLPLSPPNYHRQPDPRIPLQPGIGSQPAAGSQTQMYSQTQLDTFPLSPSTMHHHQHVCHALDGSRTQSTSQTQLDTFPLSPSTHHPHMSSHTTQPPPATTGTVIPASMTPPGTLSQMYASQPPTGLGIHHGSGHGHGQHPGMHHLSSSLDLLRVTNRTQPTAGAAGAPNSASPLLLMTHTTPASTSRSAGAPGTVFGSQSTCASLYQLHHRAHPYAPTAAGAGGAAMTMTPPESSGTLKWMPDSQMQPLTDGSIELGSGRVLTRPGVWAGASPVMAVDDGQGERERSGKRKHVSSGVTVNGVVDGYQEDEDEGARGKRVKRSAAQRPARMPTP